MTLPKDSEFELAVPLQYGRRTNADEIRCGARDGGCGIEVGSRLNSGSTYWTRL